MRRLLTIVGGTMLAAGLASAGGVGAGTRGGLYDFRYFLGQGQPAPGPAMAPSAPAPAPMAPAPPPRPAAPAPASAAPPRDATVVVHDDPLADATDGWRERFYVSIAALGIYTEDYDGTVAGTGFDLEFEPGFGLDLAVGTFFTPAFRGEFAFTYRTSGADSATIGGASANKPDIDTWSLMLNGYYDFLREWPVHPYLGGGVGVDFVDGDGFSAGGVTVDGKDDVELGVQLIAGLAWPFSERVALTLDYRYHASTDDDIFYHILQGGLRYRF